MGIPLASILERFPDLLKLHRGSGETVVDRLHVAHLAAASDMIFVSEAKHLNDAKQSQSKIWVVQTKLLESVPSEVKTVVASSNPYLAMAVVGTHLFPLRP